MDLGDRIKKYEEITRNFAMPRMPLFIRVDGKAFHTFTKHLNKPFDKHFIQAMALAAADTAAKMQGFKAAYVQSDEVTFCLTDYDTFDTQGWFGYNISKIISISAAMMSVNFNLRNKDAHNQVFDSRVFSVPLNDAINVFLWRAQDWQRNSLQMYSHANFSHKELHKKNMQQMHEMLHSKGKNWTKDLNNIEKNGVFITNKNNLINLWDDVEPRYPEIHKLIYPLINYPENENN